MSTPATTVAVPAGYAAGAKVPWWLKLGAKIVLGVVRRPGRKRRRRSVNRNTFADPGADRLVGEPIAHADRFRSLAGHDPRAVLELGPGRLVARAPAYAALVDGPVWFNDIADDLPRGVAPYAEAAGMARAAGLAPPAIPSEGGHAVALRACRATCLIGGAGALAAIPAGSVDLVISDVALEHVRRDAVPDLLLALHRISAPGALHVHAIDFHDHLGGGLNHLRFPPWFWEGRLVRRSGAYVNRLGLTDWLRAFAAAGFEAVPREVMAWAEPPLAARRIHPAARRPPADDRVCHAVIEARRRSGPRPEGV